MNKAGKILSSSLLAGVVGIILFKIGIIVKALESCYE